MQSIPVTVKRSIEIAGLFVLATIISKAQLIIIPLFLAFFVSVALLPAYRFFYSKNIPKAIAIVLALLMFISVIIVLVSFIWWHVRQVVEDFPQIEQNLKLHFLSVSAWINEKMNFSVEEQKAFIQEQRKNLLHFNGNIFNAAGVLSSAIIFLGLLPIFAFLLLFYKNVLMNFIFLWFPEKNHMEREAAHWLLWSVFLQEEY